MFIITSNRDEKISRKPALPPSIYEHNGSKLIFPPDGEAGGTWIALNENGNAAVLLNGAFENHVYSPPYKMSRGKIFLDVIASDYSVRQFNQLALTGIEPFTLVILENTDLFECRWDGKEKHCKQLKNYRQHIWSSATLYSKEIAKKREQWFSTFLNEHPNPTQQDILEFHKYQVAGEEGNSILMNRDGIFRTISITSILLTQDRGYIKYIDFVNKKETEIKIIFENHLQRA